MRREKLKLKRILILLLCFLVLAACGTSPASNNGGNSASSGQGQQSRNTSSGSSDAGSSASGSTWLDQAGLDQDESIEELYEKAKQEGRVSVYSQSSRIANVKETFEAEYPGITVEFYDSSTNDIIDKVMREQDSDIFDVDVVFIKDAGGFVSKEMVSTGRLHTYAPSDISSKLADAFKNDPGLPFYFSTRAVFYNTTDHPNGSPINNWWDLTDPEWKNTVLNDPLLNADDMDFFTTIVINHEDMAKAYKAKYGTDIVLDGTENAGYEFIKQFYANDPVFVRTTDDVAAAVGTPGTSNNPLGIASSSRARKIKDEGLEMDFAMEMNPKLSVPAVSYLYVADQAQNVNAAKLLIRWMAGEADGKAEGFAPYDVLGSWSTRLDMNRDDQTPLNELDIWPYEGDKLYDQIPHVRDFILSIQ